ncbi:oxidative stress response protein Oxr1 [Aspergillus arachidicola]|uniref:Oxidation resistance protein 1 n=1 Tax=Aspergillus arachidicola TaxID=656916 RepID=A0A2G7FVA1_9EURO|nr:oxidative stress response protein Oxr1 [Aspergillus arachidicola]
MSSTELPSSASSSRSASRSRQSNSRTHQSAASYFSYPVTHVVSGIYRRLTDPPTSKSKNNMHRNQHSMTTPKRLHHLIPGLHPSPNSRPGRGNPAASPGPPATRRHLASSYSLDRDGASLATLYENCREMSHRSPRAGYVLVVRDSSPSGAVFGAYMTDPPHPDSHYYGTGECFLWRASVLAPPTNLNLPRDGPPSEDMLELAGLPLPPSADTTHAGRSTTLRAGDAKLAPPSTSGLPSGASTPERIRFKAFPYSGVNDYMMFCETGFLSLGGGDGHYGLWVDSSLEKGVSAGCQTFGNEPLSDEGVKFDILGVEVWYVGA